MDNINYFKAMFKSIPVCRGKVSIIFLVQNDEDLLNECGFSKSDIDHLNEEFENVLMEEKEENLDHIKNEEESIIEKIFNKQMEQ